MAKHAAVATQKRWPLMVLLCVALSTAVAFFIGASFNSCSSRDYHEDNGVGSVVRSSGSDVGDSEKVEKHSPLSFMTSKLVLFVSHELSLSGGPLLLMELAFLLRAVDARVVWVTNQKAVEPDEVTYSLEHRIIDKGVEVLPAKGKESVDIALRANLVILNTGLAGKWLDAVLQENVPRVLPKVLWWIHEMRGHYFKLEYVKHLPLIAGAMIDSHATVNYWKNRTRERLGINMPKTYAVHLGNSKDLMEIAEDCGKKGPSRAR